MVSGPPPPGVRHPLDVLEDILGAQVKPLIDGDEEVAGREPVLEDAGEVEFGQLSLEEYVRRQEGREAEERELRIRARAHSANSIGECKLLSSLPPVLGWCMD